MIILTILLGVGVVFFGYLYTRITVDIFLTADAEAVGRHIRTHILAPATVASQ